MKNFWSSILKPSNPLSVKSFALLLSALVMALLSACLGVAMIIDVTKDGKLDMDLVSAGIFETCLGGLVTGSGIPKILAERKGLTIATSDEEKSEEDETKV